LGAFSRINIDVNPFTALALEKTNNDSENASQYDDACAVIQRQSSNDPIFSFFPQKFVIQQNMFGGMMLVYPF
jgi:hypothetical protein